MNLTLCIFLYMFWYLFNLHLLSRYYKLGSMLGTWSQTKWEDQVLAAQDVVEERHRLMQCSYVIIQGIWRREWSPLHLQWEKLCHPFLRSKLLLGIRAVILNREWFCLQRNIWYCLLTFLVITTRGREMLLALSG